jgi:hypothetical protein
MMIVHFEIHYYEEALSINGPLLDFPYALLLLRYTSIRRLLGQHNSLEILKGSDDGVSHSELLDFWTFSIVRYSRN